MREIPNIVRERLQATRPNSAHPDADMLSAFAERALPESERAVVTEHLARCYDCRDVLALALPETVASETIRPSLVEWREWFRTPVLRWGVVAAGFAVLAVTGMLQYHRRHVPETYLAAKKENSPVSTVVPAETRDAGKPTPGTPKASLGAETGSATASDRVNTDVVNTDAKDSANSVVAPSQDKAASMSPNQAAPAPSPTLTSPPGISTGRVAESGTANNPIGGPVKQSQPAQPATTSTITVEVSGAALPVTENAAVQVQSAPVQTARAQYHAWGQTEKDQAVDKAKAPAGALDQAYAQQVSSATILAPRWAISPTGGLLRSFDQGKTWAAVDVTMATQSAGVSSSSQMSTQTQTYPAPQNSRQLSAQSQTQMQLAKKSQMGGQQPGASVGAMPIFRALSAADSQVWAGGTSGMLYHSADGGQQWTRVFLMSAGIASTGDIVGIAFPDPQRGQITTSTRETWITLDGGQTWQKR